jgi:hypothetical protein
MKKLIGGGLAALALGLVGCGGTVAIPAAVTQTQTQTVVSTSVPPHGGITDQDRVFLSEIGDDDWFDNVTRETQFWSAHHFCDEARISPEKKAQVLQSMLDAGISLEHAANLAHAAALAYCPDQLTGVQ